MLTNSVSSVPHSFRAVSSVRQGGQSQRPEVNCRRVIFSVQCSDNSKAVASVWQRVGGMFSLSFESSYMYGPVVDLTFHLIEYGSNTVSLSAATDSIKRLLNNQS